MDQARSNLDPDHAEVVVLGHGPSPTLDGVGGRKALPSAVVD